MNNLEKMNQLVGASATKENIKNWAYENRILVFALGYEEEFESMENSIESFSQSPEGQSDVTELR